MAVIIVSGVCATQEDKINPVKIITKSHVLRFFIDFALMLNTQVSQPTIAFAAAGLAPGDPLTRTNFAPSAPLTRAEGGRLHAGLGGFLFYRASEHLSQPHYGDESNQASGSKFSAIGKALPVKMSTIIVRAILSELSCTISNC